MSRLIAISLCSLSAISFEIALTRIFSVSLSYHFAFMVVSIAMMGMALSGTVQAIYPRLREVRLMGPYALCLAAAMPAAYLLANSIPFDPARLPWDGIQILYITLYYMSLCVPFFFFGLLMSAAFSNMKEVSGSVYGADLLGAAIGSLAVLQALKMLDAGRAVFALAIMASTGAFLLGPRKSSSALALACLAVILTGPDFTSIRISPYKDLPQALQYPEAERISTFRSGFSRVDVFNSPMARFAPGLSLKYQESLPSQFGLTVDASNLNAITRADEDRLGFLSHLPSALPYEMSRPQSVLLIDPKGGLPVLMARKYAARFIYNIESAPLVLEAVRDGFSEFSGGIYERNALSGLARSRLKMLGQRFDLIDIPLTEATPSASFSMAEDYRYTVEAFGEYLRHLNDDGMISLSLYIIPPPRMEFRLLCTVLAAIRHEGVPSPERNIAAIRSWGLVNILIKRSPLTKAEIASLRGFASDNWFDMVYYPGITSDETNVYVQMPTNQYHDAFVRLISLETRGAFLKDYLFDVSATYDDKPFFNFYLKPRKVKETYRVMGDKWQYFIEEGYLLPAVFVQALVLSLIITLLPLIRVRKGAGPRSTLRLGAAAPLSYFALIGLGFMLVEIPLIQKTILPLENPQYAVAAVLFSILAGSGAGSLLSQRFRFMSSPFVLLIIAAAILPYATVLSGVFGQMSQYHVPVKIALCFFLITPLGMLLGIPFPMGMRNIADDFVPWAWAVNGCFSVLAPMGAIMLAMWAGFDLVLKVAAAAYASAFLLGYVSLFRSAKETVDPTP